MLGCPWTARRVGAPNSHGMGSSLLKSPCPPHPKQVLGQYHMRHNLATSVSNHGSQDLAWTAQGSVGEILAGASAIADPARIINTFRLPACTESAITHL